jgi:2,3-bisphosphoglycerate-dependent phosphoglycerate mutase
MARQYGDQQVLIWRRSYDTPPPPLAADDPRSERADPRYAALDPSQVPLTECLKDTVARVLPCWNDTLAPALRAGQRVLVAAHGNSMRALVKSRRYQRRRHRGAQHPQRNPLVYELDGALKPSRDVTSGSQGAAERQPPGQPGQGPGDGHAVIGASAAPTVCCKWPVLPA